MYQPKITQNIFLANMQTYFVGESILSVADELPEQSFLAMFCCKKSIITCLRCKGLPACR